MSTDELLIVLRDECGFDFHPIKIVSAYSASQVRFGFADGPFEADDKKQLYGFLKMCREDAVNPQ